MSKLLLRNGIILNLKITHLKIYPSITAIFFENLILLSSFYSPLGDMFRHKCHHQAYVNQLKHKLSNLDTMSCLLRI
jgi:hypothetical protein